MERHTSTHCWCKGLRGHEERQQKTHRRDASQWYSYYSEAGEVKDHRLHAAQVAGFAGARPRMPRGNRPTRALDPRLTRPGTHKLGPALLAAGAAGECGEALV